MPRTTIRLASFAVILAALFTGGWAVGEQFPTDPVDHPADDHATDDHATDDHTNGDHTNGDHQEVGP